MVLRRPFWLWVMILAAVGAGGWFGWRWHQRAPLRRGEAALAAGAWREAQEQVAALLRDPSTRGRAARIIALALLGEGKALDAEQYFALAEALSTADLAARAKGLLDAGQWSESASVYREVLDREPENSVALQRLCGVYVMMNRLDAARAMAARLCQTSDRAAAGHVMLGVILKRTEYYFAAAQQFQQALAVDPELAAVPIPKGEVLADLGECLLRAARPGEAAAVLEEAAALAPSADAWYNLAMARYQLGETNAADEALGKARRLDTDHVGVLALGAKRAVERGDAAAAVKLLLRATAFDPDDAQLHYSLAMAHQRAGNAAAASASLQRAKELRQAAGSVVKADEAARR